MSARESVLPSASVQVKSTSRSFTTVALSPLAAACTNSRSACRAEGSSAAAVPCLPGTASKKPQNRIPRASTRITKRLMILDPPWTFQTRLYLKEGPEARPALRIVSKWNSQPTVSLKDEFQTQLDGAVAARAKDWVESRAVRSGAAATELAWHRRSSKCTLAIGTGGTPWIGEVRMVEDVEGFSAELCLDSLSEFEALGDGQVYVVKTGVTKDVATHGAECSGGIGNQHRLAIKTDVASSCSQVAQVRHLGYTTIPEILRLLRSQSHR